MPSSQEVTLPTEQEIETDLLKTITAYEQAASAIEKAEIYKPVRVGLFKFIEARQDKARRA